MKKLYKMMSWVMNFCYLQLLWLVFTVLGLGIFGFFPATVSVFEVSKRWLEKDSSIPSIKEFAVSFKKSFFKSNILGFVLTLVFLILYVDCRYFSGFSGWNGVLKFFTYFLVYLYLGILIFIFPTYVYFNFTLLDNLKFSFLFSVSRPLSSFLIIASSIVLSLLFHRFPGVILLCGTSLISFLWMWGAMYVFGSELNLDNT